MYQAESSSLRPQAKRLMATETELHLRQTSEGNSPRVKPQPNTKSISVPFTYTPSDDGTDENLLILLHGLGEPGVTPDLIVIHYLTSLFTHSHMCDINM